MNTLKRICVSSWAITKNESNETFGHTKCWQLIE